MSCYIYYYLKKKDTPMKDWHICLAHLCTSDARELSDGLSEYGETYIYGSGQNVFSENKVVEDPNYGYYHPLSQELLDNTIRYYEDQINERKDSKTKYLKEKEDAERIYLQATSKVVLDDIKERINDANEMIVWCDEEIAKFLCYRNYISDAVKGVLEENEEYHKDGKTNQYELVYYMG